MKRISLSRGKFALVDDADYQELSRYKWSAQIDNNTFYATRRIQINKKRQAEQMHRRILGLKFGDGKHTDHINGNGLDNRRVNLRVCTHEENIQNQTTKQRNNKSGFKGVSWNEGKWRAVIGINYRQKNLGRFKLKIDAALAYNAAAIRYFGKFAKLNQIK